MSAWMSLARRADVQVARPVSAALATRAARRLCVRHGSRAAATSLLRLTERAIGYRTDRFSHAQVQAYAGQALAQVRELVEPAHVALEQGCRPRIAERTRQRFAFCAESIGAASAQAAVTDLPQAA
jgi:hypothetical protein